MGQNLLQQKIWAYFTPLFLIASPLLSYYALNFLPNVPAPVEIFNYLIILMLCFVDFLGILGLTQKEYNKKTTITIIFAAFLTLGINYVWIAYLKWYAVKFGYIGNLLGILPIWGLTETEVHDYWKLIQNKWLYQMYYPYMFDFLIGCSVFIILFRKKVSPHLFLTWVLLFLFQIVFVLLFFQAFYHHDYYWINTFVFVPFTLLCVFSIIEKWHWAYAKNVSLVFFAALLLVNVKHSRHIILERYYGKLSEGINPVLQHITPYLRSIGISKDDYVVSIPDASPNISLYLMGQKGCTECYTKEYKNIKHFVAQNAKYLIVNAEITREKDWYPPFMTEQIGEYQGVKIYRLHP